MCKSLSTKGTAAPSHPLTSAYSQATILKTVAISQSAGCPPSRQLPQYKGTFPGRVPGLTEQRKHPGSRKQNSAGFSWPDENVLLLLGKSRWAQHSEQVLQQCAAAVRGSSATSLGVCALLTFVKRQSEEWARAWSQRRNKGYGGSTPAGTDVSVSPQRGILRVWGSERAQLL